MEKKYQVFVSSTYRDLADERKEVMQALLELDCIPVGMELFPAADDDQWTLIKRLIEDCDYYILIVGGRYGSLNSDGVSFTQMEYDYALSQEVPIIGFLHKKPEDIPTGKSETDPSLRQKLDEFKRLVQNKLCRYWESPTELGSLVSRSLVRLIKDKPRPGWVKSIYLPSEDTSKEILALRKQVEDLSNELAATKGKGPEGTEGLSKGQDQIRIDFVYNEKSDDWRIKTSAYADVAVFTWDEIFAQISPLLIDETSQSNLIMKVNELIRKKYYRALLDQLKKENKFPTELKITDNSFQTLKVQFRALGLIVESSKKRSIHDKESYWKLTPYGDTIMTRLRAIRNSDVVIVPKNQQDQA